MYCGGEVLHRLSSIPFSLGASWLKRGGIAASEEFLISIQIQTKVF